MRRRMPKNLQFDFVDYLEVLTEKLSSNGVSTDIVEQIFSTIKFFLKNNKKYKSVTVATIRNKLASCGCEDNTINNVLNEIYSLYPSLA